jgi:hypothetical protein
MFGNYTGQEQHSGKAQHEKASVPRGIESIQNLIDLLESGDDEDLA